ncbi:transmembrane protein 134 isoform X5 [Sus scrofa]|uniref:transmembrane protein 134 isoform X5 n=1 Tax=Sus scrofa TaxID=9823 RepID=UPI000A2B01BC|nr:transmembrane protein 134 isoform X5 [Sus scrofa]
MSAARPQFCIDDAFELSLEDAGPGPESGGVARFGPLHFERRARFEVAEEDKQSRLRYQNLENDEDGAQASPEPDGGVSTRNTQPMSQRVPLPPHWAHSSCRDSGRTSIRSSQWSFSTISSSTQRSYNACCSWTQHPLIQKNRRVVLASFLLLLLGLGPPPCHQLLPPAPVLTLAAPSVCSADPDRRGTGGGPLARCLQRHLLRARLPVAGPGSPDQLTSLATARSWKD